MKRFAVLFALVGACNEPALETIPEVDLETLDPRAAGQIRAAREKLDERSADAQGRFGMLLHAYHLDEPAKACYRNAHKLAPAEGRWLYYLALLDHADGNLDAARAAFTTADGLLVDKAQRIALLCNRGELELDANRPAKAAAHYRSVLALNPRAAVAFLGLGQCLLEQGNADGALVELQRADKLSPNAGNIRHVLGLAYRKLGHMELAEGYLADKTKRARLLAHDPLLDEVRTRADSAYLYRKRGNAYFGIRAFRRAIPEYERAVELDPDDATSRANLGAALASTGSLERAELQFREALRVDPEHPAALLNLGTLLARRRKDAEAITLYERILAVDAAHESARFNMANALARLGRFGDAREHYAVVVAAAPANLHARRGEARMLTMLGRDIDALARLEATFRAFPDDDGTKADLARLLAASPDDQVRNGKRSLSLAQDLFALNPTLHYGVTVAMAHAAMGDFADAVAMQQRFIAAAREAHKHGTVKLLEKTLTLYESKRPCTTPWPREDITSPSR